MSAVNIAGTFKRDERPLNGLEAIVEELLDRDNATAEYVIVAKIRPHASKWKAEDNVETPTVKFGHIEVLDGADADQAQEMLNRAYRKRTNRDNDPQDQLPFDGPVSERKPDEWLADAVTAGD